jgi:hypothetical protein
MVAHRYRLLLDFSRLSIDLIVNGVINNAMPASERFPQIAFWSVEFMESGKPQPKLQSYSWDRPVAFMECSNPACKKGGFALDGLYEELANSGALSNGPDGQTVFCSGSEFAGQKPLGKGCNNKALVKISLVRRN